VHVVRIYIYIYIYICMYVCMYVYIHIHTIYIVYFHHLVGCLVWLANVITKSTHSTWSYFYDPRTVLANLVPRSRWEICTTSIRGQSIPHNLRFLIRLFGRTVSSISRLQSSLSLYCFVNLKFVEENLGKLGQTIPYISPSDNYNLISPVAL